MADLERIGLAKNGQLSLDEDVLNALLSGRRTDMLRLENLKADGMLIRLLDVKLSLRPNEKGVLELLAHPIHKDIAPPYYLTAEEAEQLEKGEKVNIDKIIVDKDGKAKEVLIEFDPDTNEFIITDTEQVLAPEEINGLPLTQQQKERYRKGQEVETADGTTIQYSANEKQGIRSDRLALIASILVDGGVSYLLFKGLNALFNKPQKKEPGANYQKTMDKLKSEGVIDKGVQPDNDAEEEQSERSAADAPVFNPFGIRPEVQEFFAPFYSADQGGDLCFWYGKELEHFGLGFHRVPVSADFWLAGNLNLSQVREVIISGSALDGVSWLNKKAAYLPHFENLLFLSTGAGVREEHIRWIKDHLRNRECLLINSRDLPGAMADLKLAAAIRGLPLDIWFAGGRIAVSFRMRTFSFSPENFSLNVFEKASCFRFGIRTEKPKAHLTFFDELKAEAFFTF